MNLKLPKSSFALHLPSRPEKSLTGAIGPMKFKSSSVIIPFITGGSSLMVPG
jgi:hypothetical protein